ncbi:host attachment family protein [Phyllobacterium zundukense]|uniref:Host cell attachment protein n=1 Tax=Phyllobacterium zundukense TaxID=1867719 RepID=A0A2N9VYN8_9HYPH|nr:host attachment protein [Phyllobacterium zundukense]ATU95191.1 host cell attachment protein [Phyllobacterium zundukense]PIO44606.1 host cell attachment protein [Phyllobacterium zundukense]
MQLPKGATVAVADGEKFNLFQNISDDANLKLTALAEADVDTENNNASAGRKSSSANPDQGQADEDNFAAGIADILNQQVLKGKITGLVIIAAPKALGELRKHYHKELETILLGEIAKDLTGHSIQDIEKTIGSS